MINEKNRIKWVDIFKAITIILVVIGHATGKYNMYIYQFHMAAFFFISGYTTNLEKRSFLGMSWNKVCTMVLPVIAMFLIGIFFVAALDWIGCYQLLFADPFIGIDKAIIQFFEKGNNYVLWMGATWFIYTLFGVVVFHKFIFELFGQKNGIGYKSCSIILFILGYLCVKNGVILRISFISMDLIFIGQFYFFLGKMCKDYKIIERFLSSLGKNAVILLITLIILYYYGNVKVMTVDYPSRHFESILNNVIAAINGTIFIYLISYYISKLEFLSKFTTVIGRNTIGIIFFHFMFFNVGYVILYLFGIVPLSYLQNFIPTEQIGNKYWLLFVIISISFSMVLWKILIRSKLISFFTWARKG